MKGDLIMKKKCELIREFAKECDTHGEKHLCVMAKGFKAKGKLYTGKEIEGLITLTNAHIKPYKPSAECEVNGEHKTLEWLNIFADDIIAFSFTE